MGGTLARGTLDDSDGIRRSIGGLPQPMNKILVVFAALLFKIPASVRSSASSLKGGIVLLMEDGIGRRVGGVDGIENGGLEHCLLLEYGEYTSNPGFFRSC